MQAVRKITRLPIEVHLMIQQPDRYARAFVEAGADMLIVHLEAYHDPQPDDRDGAGDGLPLLAGDQPDDAGGKYLLAC